MSDFKVNEDLVNASKDELLNMVRTGKVDVPSKGSPERDDFEKFIAFDPGSEERKSFLSSGEVNDPDPDPDPNSPDEDNRNAEPPPSDNKSEEPPVKTEEPPPPPAENDVDDWGGYGSKEAMLDAHKSLLKAVEQKQKEVNKLRATGGKQGRRIKDLEEQIASGTEEMERLRNVDSNAHSPAGDNGNVKKPEKPVKPNASDFEDGEIDPAYESALQKYDSALDEYEAGLEAYYKNLQDKNNSYIQKEIEETKKAAKDAKRFVDEQRDREAETAAEQAWNNMWEESRNIQAQLGCKTSIPIEQINDAILNKDSRDEDAKAAALAFLKSVPESDLKNYWKVNPVINGMYFAGGDGLPKKTFPNLQAALWSLQDKTGRPLAERFADVNIPSRNLSAEQAKQVKKGINRTKESVSALPADGHQGSHDPRIDAPNTNAEKKVRLKELTNMRRQNPREFDSNPKFLNEWKSLLSSLGYYGGKRAGS